MYCQKYKLLHWTILLSCWQYLIPWQMLKSTVMYSSNSRSCIQAINRYNNVNPLVRMIQRRIATCGRQATLCWVPSHVGVAMNEKADQAARSIITNDRPGCSKYHYKWQTRLLEVSLQMTEQAARSIITNGRLSCSKYHYKWQTKLLEVSLQMTDQAARSIITNGRLSCSKYHYKWQTKLLEVSLQMAD